ncbi:MAG: acetyl-CoA carboxylase biotin carboxyl carrier protein [Epsilonproteobacteria bacterium]|nr:acetyl-CoA carboxylase biotin carboxyl carrier protein [Campylobacterota bacterium]OIO13830.1 MAG: acetyl-CoA carboxylase, biotin carboxyl carrier protein [Helicobacteraceae bacterium CG1_02_36_14]PIP11479.1 MAG: acetyl-CoA carboxylase, biotin carboxyl carrier protein [Sulfurimonas sp. CG23_combo_of_CG06-09_8_20_14_all_36_33]PIS25098.1 MAG: acetyl-CoA carboxylase, biotin carboxyl carrier protein [Sulfurimonas sp. CG08_land_8_20_14_0_20_36_33]PIU34639.1 MAG: acetyl-CoA carboxylase, biotin car
MDTKQIKALMRDFDESGLSRVKITKDEFSIEMEKATGLVAAPVSVAQAPAPLAAPAPAAAPTPSAPAQISGDFIVSPMVGTYYSSPSPDSPPFAKVGDTIKKGQVVAILEAMKIMNELEAEFNCKILEVLATNGQAVEYDMPLYVVEKI